MEPELNKDKEDMSMEKDGAGEEMNIGMLILDKLKNQSDARLGFDRWVYESINKMKKRINIGKKRDTKVQETESNGKRKWMKRWRSWKLKSAS